MKGDGYWAGALHSILLIATVPCQAYAGYDEGANAFQTENYEEAIKQWMPLAEAEEADAQYNIGCMFANGIGIPQNMTLAVKWMRQAAEHQDASAWWWLARHNVEGFKGLPPFKALPSNRFKLSMALKLTNGSTIIWDCVTEERNGADIFFRMGLMFDKGGMGPPQDASEAAKWYEKAIEKGHVTAKILLAFLLVEGRGVGRDVNRAGQLFLKAASEGDSRAQGEAGTMFERGWGGVSVHLPTAYAMYAHAVRGGDVQTQRLFIPRMHDIKTHMSQDEVKEGDEIDARWQKTGQPPSRLLSD